MSKHHEARDHPSVMDSDLLRVYFDPDEIGPDGYPYVWHGRRIVRMNDLPSGDPPYRYAEMNTGIAVKDLIRQQAGNRCERCGHPYERGMGEWSPCDEQCNHAGPGRWIDNTGAEYMFDVHHEYADLLSYGAQRVEAQWRILTVHHLNGIKHDLRWWNLAALCQRCHLVIQGKVRLENPWIRTHTEWFKPHAAGYYASDRDLQLEYCLGTEPSREWVLAHMETILEPHVLQAMLDALS